MYNLKFFFKSINLCISTNETLFLYTLKKDLTFYMYAKVEVQNEKKEKDDEEEKESDPHLGTHIRSIIYINVYVVECLYFLKKF